MAGVNRNRTAGVNTISYTITKGLGYCCEWYFFSYFRKLSNRLIAARLGFSQEAVRERRKQITECERKDCCMVVKVSSLKRR